MKAQIFSLVKRGVLAIATLLMVASCDMWHTDTDDCPTGIYVKFKYDYNLQRADMFNDHVGAVTLYVYDENGNFVKKFEEANSLSALPLKNIDYKMHITDLQPGKYQFIALAGQKSYTEQLNTQRAKFVHNPLSC